jgi:hypothetical protein
LLLHKRQEWKNGETRRKEEANEDEGLVSFTVLLQATLFFLTFLLFMASSFGRATSCILHFTLALFAGLTG